MQEESEFQFTEKDIDFGRTKYTPQIGFAKVIDIDHQLLRIPYLIQKTHTVAQLLESYWLVTSHRNKFKGKACFRIVSGKDSKKIADKNGKLRNFELSTVCFRVQDQQNLNENFSDIDEFLKKQSIQLKEEDLFEISVDLNGKKIKIRVAKTLTIPMLKDELIKVVPGLHKQSQQSISLVVEGKIIENLKKVEDIDISKQIKIVIVSRCSGFKGTTKILLSNQQYVPISQIKVGAKIMTFNRDTFTPEEAQVTQIYQGIVTEIAAVKLKNGHEIKSTLNHLFLCQDGTFRLIKSKDPKQLCLVEKQKLRLFQGQTQEVISIQHRLIPPETFYSVSSDRNGNIVIDDGVVSQEQYIKVKNMENNAIYPVDAIPTDQFKSVKQRLQVLTFLNLSNRNLRHIGQILKDQHTLADKNIKNEVTLSLSKPAQVQKQEKQEILITFVVLIKGKQRQKISLNLSKKMNILEVKEKLEQIIKVPKEKLHFSFQGESLFNISTLEQAKITKENIIIVRENQKTYRSSFVFEEGQQEEHIQKTKMITFQRDTGQKYLLQYEPFRNWTVRQIFKQYIGITDPAYFIIFADILIFCDQPLYSIQQSPFFQEPQLTVLVLKNQKLSFLTAISLDSSKINNSSVLFLEQEMYQFPMKSQICVPNSSEFSTKFTNAKKQVQKNSKIQEKLKKEYFYQPFVYFTSKQYHKQIESYIKNFDSKRTEINKFDSMFAIIKTLYQNMQSLPNYRKKCFYGIRNFRGSKIFSPGHSFYIHNFVLAFKQKQNVTQQLEGHSGTLFHISSTSSKDIKQFSFYPKRQHILLNSFTYFLVEKAIYGDKMDQVWLTQIPSPVTFKKDIILWVDDQPDSAENRSYYDLILGLKPELQILQVTSTVAAQHWIQQFGWILNYKGLEFKLISDMGRVQWKNDKEQMNYEAGIDLIELLYKMRGYTARTLIFCGNKQKAKQNANKRQIPEQRYKITTNATDLFEFVGLTFEEAQAALIKFKQ